MKQTLWERKVPFLGVFSLILLVTYGFLTLIDFLPEPIVEDDQEEVVLQEVRGFVDGEELEASEEAFAEVDPLPTRIIIDELGRDVEVLNPQSRTIADLDEALLDGVVRHPDSATLADNGHMFLFGHSSFLPTVHNRNFQAFNGIEKLEWGDIIRVQSGDTEYIYRVVENYEVEASRAEVTLDHSKARLTLATCNSFGSIDDRFVVEAELISSHAL